MVYRDKKMDGQKVSFILSRGIGKHEIVQLSPKELLKLLK
jgi:3-dehydroquinate synthetase